MNYQTLWKLKIVNNPNWYQYGTLDLGFYQWPGAYGMVTGREPGRVGSVMVIGAKNLLLRNINEVNDKI